MIHPDECGPCAECAEALEDYRRMASRSVAELELRDRVAYWRTVPTIKACKA